MQLLNKLAAYALRQTIGIAAEHVGASVLVQAAGGAADGVVAFAAQHFTDHSQALPQALATAGDRAWQTLGIALAGDGILDRLKRRFANADDKGFREQVTRFLNSGRLGFEGTPLQFRKQCLTEFCALQESGLISAERLDLKRIAEQTGHFARYADVPALVAGAWDAVHGVADTLAADYPNLAKLLRQPATGEPPLLAAAFCFFFRRELETKSELFRGLTWTTLRDLTAAQEAGFAAVENALTAPGPRFDEIIGEIAGVKVAVIDMHVDVRARLGAAEARLSSQITELAARNPLPTGPPRPQFVISINNEREQALARRLLAEVRKLPPERQHADDLALLGDVLRAAGLHQEATTSYAGAVEQCDDPAARARAHYKLYLTALEQRHWDEGLAALTAAADLDAQHYAPFPLRKYQPQRILGAGGFGAAFLCRDRYLGRDVVVKSIYHAELEQGLDKVFAEAQTLLLLSREHPSIIGVQDCNFADDAQERPYIVMDYFPGVSLQAHLEQLGPKAVLSLEDFLPVARQIAEAMRAAHGRDVLHRDLKPDNVLVRHEDGRWQAKVIDFGLAVRRRAVEVSTSRPAHERTRLGDSVAGTAEYASPEQMGKMPGIAVDKYSDVYSFGKLCCYALFRTTEPKRRHWDSVPHELADMLEHCTENELEHRTRDFTLVLKVLDGPHSALGTKLPATPQTLVAELPPPPPDAVSPAQRFKPGKALTVRRPVHDPQPPQEISLHIPVTEPDPPRLLVLYWKPVLNGCSSPQHREFARKSNDRRSVCRVTGR